MKSHCLALEILSKQPPPALAKLAPRLNFSWAAWEVLLLAKSKPVADLRLFMCSTATYWAHLPRDWPRPHKYSCKLFDLLHCCVLEPSRRQGEAIITAACETLISPEQSATAPLITEKRKHIYLSDYRFSLA